VSQARPPQEDVRRLESEVETVRREIETSIAELRRRGRDVARLHRNPVAIVAVAGVAAIGTVAAVLTARRRRRKETAQKWRRVGKALRRAARYPERVAPEEPPVTKGLLAAAAVAAGTAIGRRLVAHAFGEPPPEAR